MGSILSGLASGFDWSSMVDQLVAISRIPQDRLRTEKSAVSQQNTALNDIKSLVSDFQTSAQALGGSDLFLKRSASLASTNSTWSSTAASGTPLGDYSVTVGKLATATRAEGTTNVGRAISASANVSGVVVSAMNLSQPVRAGQFSVNGVKITVATTDTLEEVFARISNDTDVTAEYDPDTDRITLTNDQGGPVSLGSANDTSNFLQSLKLFNNGGAPVTSTTALGVVKLSSAISQSGLNSAISGVDGAGAGTFKINGTSIAYNVNSDSLQNIVARINASDAGVSASYDASRDGFVLTNKVTGDLAITIEEGPGGLLAAMGVQAGAGSVAGTNAEFSVNGGATIISTSNVLDESAHGITGLSVTSRSLGTETVHVGADSKESRAKIDDFIAKFNAVQNSIEKNTKVSTVGTKVTAAVLAGNREITEIGRSLRAMVFSSGPGGTSLVNRLTDLGIDFKGIESTLTIRNSAALDAKLVEHAAETAKFFGDATSGLVTRLNSLVQRQIGVNGSLPMQSSNLDKRSLDLDRQIANMERRLASQRTLLESNFVEMERAQSIIKQQSQALTSAFESNNG